MDDYKYEQRRKKRGEYCVSCGSYVDEKTGKTIYFGIHCGCGDRVPPNKRHKKKIVRRSLKQQLRDRLNEETN